MAMEHTPQAGSAGSARPIEDFAEDARNLDAAAFAEKHAHAFLLLSSTHLKAPAGVSSTEVLLDDFEDDPRARTANLAVLVFPMRPAQGHLVTLGRAPNNDVVIVDPSISRFHAMAKRSDDAGFLILDARSTNGTTVNGASVAARGTGPATGLKPGDTIRMGQVEFTFTDARTFQEFAREAGG